MILLKIAFRNLREHKTKTLIIGLLIAIGITLLVVGNSVMLSITEGMQRTYRANFTGDLILRSTSEDPVSFLGGGFGVSPPPLRNYSALRDYVRAQPEVVATTPLLSGLATINKDDKALSLAFLWGIEPSSYADMFPGSFTLFAGEWLRDGEAGIVLSQATVDRIFEWEGVRLEPGDTILLEGQNNITGTRIREVTVRGIGSFANTAGLTEMLSFVDATTLRALAGLVAVQVDRAPAAPVAVDESSLFGGESDLFGDSLVGDAGERAEAAVDFDNILGDTSVRERFLSLDNNAWHFLLVRTQHGSSLTPLQRTLSEASPSEGLLVETWRWGADFVAELAYGIRLILNVFIILIAVVAVIIIMNTLVISVTERIAEIGTVRALGGQKSFVRRMITLEVLMISVLFGLVGIALGSLIIGIFNVIGVPATNLFLEIFLGGSELRLVLAVSSLFTSVAVVTIIGVVASLYPTSVALGVSPVQAMGRKA